MSDTLRIALVHEGDTDRIVIEAILNQILAASNQTFILTSLQPEKSIALDLGSNYGPKGAGWGGIYKWCRDLDSMGSGLDNHSKIQQYNLLIFHIDGDVAEKNYTDVLGSDPASRYKPRQDDLPTSCSCPPAEDCINKLRDIVARWLNLASAQDWPRNWVFCTPSKCTDTWVTVALSHESPNNILTQLECRDSGKIKNCLKSRPKDQRIAKTVDYRKASENIQQGWDEARKLCTQAERFQMEFLAALG